MRAIFEVHGWAKTNKGDKKEKKVGRKEETTYILYFCNAFTFA